MFFAFLFKSRQRLFIGLCLSFCFLFLINVNNLNAMPVGTLLYRTASNGNMYGYNSNKLLDIKNGLIRSVYTGHVAIYVGQENGVDYIVEASPKGIIKVPAKYFINLDKGEEFIGAKIPKNLSETQRLKVSLLAKSLANSAMSYDFDFRNQKGPGSGDWTCVGLVEKIYESANITNPLNVSALEYNPENYAIDITPDGFDNYSIINDKNGDVLSASYEYSRISKVKNVLFPAPEKLAFNAGKVYRSERYFFFPMTQFLQSDLEDVEVDLSRISSNFKDEHIRGKIPSVSLAFKWTLINNPLSSLENSLNSFVAFFNKDKNQDVLSFLEEDKITNSENYNDLAYHFNVQEDLSLIDDSQDETLVETIVEVENPETIELEIEKLVYNDNDNDNDEDFFSTNVDSSNPKNYEVFAEVEKPEEKEFVDLKDKANLLISKIYTTGKDDYIEIFNDSDVSIDLTELGLRLYKTKTRNSPYLMIRFGNESDASYPGGLVVKSKSAYLIVRSDANEDLLAKADVVAHRKDFNLTGDAYTVYLSLGVVSGDDDEDIIDKVGYGAARYYYGRAAPEIINDHVLIRRASQDSMSFDKPFIYNSNNNYFDFILFSLIKEEESPKEDEVSDVVEEEDVVEEVEELDVPDDIVSSPDLLISHVHSTAKDDYIVIYNNENEDVNLSEKNIRLYKTKTREIPYLMLRFNNNLDASYPGGLVIKSKSSYMIVRADASDILLEKADAIVNRSEFTFSGDAYTIYLSDGVVSSDSDEDIIDKLGYGFASFYYDFPAPEILDEHVLIRKARSDSNSILMAPGCEHDLLGNSYNTYDNSHDFVLLDLSLVKEGVDYCNPELADKEESIFSNLDYNYCMENGLAVDYLLNVWHFNECKGGLAYDFASDNNALGLDVKWINGSYGCGISHYEDDDNLTFNLNSKFNSNNFTLLFNYKILYPNSRPQFRFNNSETNASFQFELFAYYTEFRGFPNLPFRDDSLHWPLSNEWQQFSLVVNREEDYFAMYNNGVEYLRKNIGSNFFPDVDQLVFVATGNDTEFDELAVFSQALEQDELLNFYNEFKELNTSNCASKKFKEAKLLSFYNFDNNEIDDSGDCLLLSDIVVKDDGPFSSLCVDSSDILNSNNNNYLQVDNELNYSIINLDDLAPSRDWSLSLWFKRDNLEDPFITPYFHFQLLFNSHPYFGFNLSDVLKYNFSSLDFEVDDSFDLLHDNWQHIALVYDSYKFHFKIYIDGDLEFIITKDWLDKTNFNGVSLASFFSSSYIDDLMVFSGVLSPLDLVEIYDSTKIKFMQ